MRIRTGYQVHSVKDTGSSQCPICSYVGSRYPLPPARTFTPLLYTWKNGMETHVHLPLSTHHDIPNHPLYHFHWTGRSLSKIFLLDTETQTLNYFDCIQTLNSDYLLDTKKCSFHLTGRQENVESILLCWTCEKLTFFCILDWRSNYCKIDFYWFLGCLMEIFIKFKGYPGSCELRGW